MHRDTLAAALLALAVGLGVAGCGGSGGLRIATPGNIAIDAGSVAIPASVHRGTPLLVTFVIDAETPKYNVGITIDVVPLGGAILGTGDVDPTSPEYDEQGHSIAGVVVDVPAGSTPLELPFEIPDDLPAGQYVVVLHVNKHDVTPDDDHLQQEHPEDADDNTVVTDAILTVTLPDHPNLVVVSCASSVASIDTFEAEAIFVPSDDPMLGFTPAFPVPVVLTIEAHSYTVPAGVEAHVEMFDEGTEMWLPVKLSGIVDHGTIHDSYVFPELRVGTTADLDDPVTEGTRPTSRQGATFFALIPDERIGLAALAGDIDLQLRVLLDAPDAVTEQDETPGVLQDDNICQFSVVILQVPPEPAEMGSLAIGPTLQPQLVVPSSIQSWLWSDATPRPLTSSDNSSNVLQDSRTTAAYYGNKDFGAGHAFGVSNSWQNTNQTHAYGPRAKATFFTGYGNVYLDLAGSRITMVDVRGGALNDSCIPVLRKGWEIRVLGVSLWSSYTTGGGTVSFDQSYSREKSVGKTILVGPVPVKFEVGAEGTIGVKATLSVAAGPIITAKVGPYAGLTGFASASIELVVASGGVTAEIDVLTVDVAIVATLTVPCPTSGGPSLQINTPWSIRTLDGKIYLWVKYPSPTWSNPGRKKTKTFTIVEWKGLQIASGNLWTYGRSW